MQLRKRLSCVPFLILCTGSCCMSILQYAATPTPTPSSDYTCSQEQRSRFGSLFQTTRGGASRRLSFGKATLIKKGQTCAVGECLCRVIGGRCLWFSDSRDSYFDKSVKFGQREIGLQQGARKVSAVDDKLCQWRYWGPTSLSASQASALHLSVR